MLPVPPCGLRRGDNFLVGPRRTRQTSVGVALLRPQASGDGDRFRSATNAKEAETPPIVGSVRIDAKGSRGRVSTCSTAVVFAIWNSELTPSCMRAPPDAEMQTKGTRFS